MRHIFVVFTLLVDVVLLVSCSNDFPFPSFPQENISRDNLDHLVLAYCWENPDGRTSSARPTDSEVEVVVSNGNGEKIVVARHEMNMPSQNLSDFVIYKIGCVKNDTKKFLKYSGFDLSWRPQTSELTFVGGSSSSLTHFNSIVLTGEFNVNDGGIDDYLDGYKSYFWFPRGVYWSSDGRKIATLGRDVGELNSGGDNIWVYDSNHRSFTRITDFTQAGDFVANVGWSNMGNALAIEYRNNNGVGIAEIDSVTNGITYIDISHKSFPELNETWPCAFKSITQLLLNSECASFNSYISVNSIPVWVNNDAQIIFSAVSKSKQATLFMVNSDGTNLHPLIPKLSGIIFMPRLSPDDRTLAFARYPSWKNTSIVEIGTVDIFTKDLRSLVVLSSFDGKADVIISGMDWSPDGSYLAFSSNHAGESDIYIVSSNGDSWFNLTDNIDGNAVSPAWKPE